MVDSWMRSRQSPDEMRSIFRTGRSLRTDGAPELLAPRRLPIAADPPLHRAAMATRSIASPSTGRCLAMLARASGRDLRANDDLWHGTSAIVSAIVK